MSELYGRLKPLYFGYAVFVIFQIPVGVAQNLQTILICRFIIGLLVLLHWQSLVAHL
jgi:MFS family permease